jgi:acyl-CoA thioesterase
MDEKPVTDFERETLSLKKSDDLWEANITNNWSINKIPNGGYLIAIAARILKEKLPHKDPLTITGHYVHRTEHGPIDCHTEILNTGKNFSTGLVKFIQNGIERIHFTATYTDFSKHTGISHYEGEAPELPPPDDCVQMPSFGQYSLYDQVDLRMVPESAKWMEGKLEETSEITGWIKHHNKDETDRFTTLLFADAFPPPIMARIGIVAWVPTLELTVHLKKPPAPGYLKCRFSSRFLTKGILEEDGELWDRDGELVAVSRQIAQLRMTSK